MGALNRIATEMNIGATTTGGGLGVEVAKHYVSGDTNPVCGVIEVAAPVVIDNASTSIDIMLFDWFFWTDVLHINTGGLIAFIGLAVMLHGAYRGRKETKKREERDKLN